jgi:hypothetical protein
LGILKGKETRMYRIQIDEETYKALRRVGYENDVSITSDGACWVAVKKEFYNNLPIWKGKSPEVVMGFTIFEVIVKNDLKYLQDL